MNAADFLVIRFHLRWRDEEDYRPGQIFDYCLQFGKLDPSVPGQWVVGREWLGFVFICAKRRHHRLS